MENLNKDYEGYYSSNEELSPSLYGDCSTINVDHIRDEETERRVPTMILKIPAQQQQQTKKIKKNQKKNNKNARATTTTETKSTAVNSSSSSSSSSLLLEKRAEFVTNRFVQKAFRQIFQCQV